MNSNVSNFYEGYFTPKEIVDLRLKFCVYKLIEDVEVERLKSIFKTPVVFKDFIRYLCMDTRHDYDDIIEHYSYIFDNYSVDITKAGVHPDTSGGTVVVCGEPIEKGRLVIMMNGKAYSHVSRKYNPIGVSMESGDVGDGIMISILQYG